MALFEGREIVDMSYSYSSNTIHWPTEKSFLLEKGFHGFTSHGYYYSSNSFTTAEHAGTHVDAPIHFHENGKTIDEIELQELMGPLVVIDVTEKSQIDRDYRVNSEDFLNFEEKYGKIPDASIILLETGFGKFWPDAEKYLGTNKVGEEALPDLHFPGLHQEGAQWLVDNRNIKSIGIDTSSIDYGQSSLFESHVILCGNNIKIFENVANVDKVPVVNAYIVALPMKIEGGTGSPCRIMAYWDRNNT